MPPINLDEQVFFDSNHPIIPKVQRQKPDALCENAPVFQPQPVTPSDDDAIVISSDDETDYEDSASVRSSSSLPSIDQLLADTQDCGKLVDTDERDPMEDGPEPRSLFLSSTQEDDSNMPNIPRSSASPCSLALAGPILLPNAPPENSVSVQLVKGLPDSVALGSQSQPDEVVCSPEADTQNGATGITHGTDASQSVGSYNVPACESGDDEDSGQSHQVKSRLRRRKTSVRYASCSTATSGTDSADENQHRRKRRRTAEHAQKDLQDDPYEPPNSDSDQDQAPRQPLSNGFHGLSSSNETEVDQDDDGICHRPSESSRRRKAITSPSSNVPRRSTRKKPQSASGNSSRRCSSAAGRYAPTSKFEEWPLGQAVLKRITIDGLAGINTVSRPRSGTTSATTKRNQGTARSNFTPEEDGLIITLKDQGLSWKDIHTQYQKKFPERAVGYLQVRYNTKLKDR
ncbi:hypothetical protein ACQKWADRAFT_331280 [Trichoderma austrokoningii]